MHPFCPRFVLLAASVACAPGLVAQARGLAGLAGEWLYVQDRTEGRPVEEQQPPMSVTFGLRVEEDAVVMLRGQGDRRREERYPFDGTVEVPGKGTTSRYRAELQKEGVLCEVEVVRATDGVQLARIRRVFRVHDEGLMVRVTVGDPASLDSLALYRHPEDIALPQPAAATIADVAWIAGAWGGQRGAASTEERWSPAGGGAMLGVSRTIKGGRMVGFEYLRIVERDGGLVYVAQPGGKAPTEFVLTERGDQRAVFENPRHDSPQRIVYALSDDGVLTASIGFIHGGRPRAFTFTRE